MKGEFHATVCTEDFTRRNHGNRITSRITWMVYQDQRYVNHLSPLEYPEFTSTCLVLSTPTKGMLKLFRQSLIEEHLVQSKK